MGQVIFAVVTGRQRFEVFVRLLHVESGRLLKAIVVRMLRAAADQHVGDFNQGNAEQAKVVGESLFEKIGGLHCGSVVGVTSGVERQKTGPEAGT